MKQQVIEKLKSAFTSTKYRQEQENYGAAIQALESTSDIFEDMRQMHDKYGVHNWMANATPEQLSKFLQFRIDFLNEELTETTEAFANKDAEEVVDGLIDLIVIAAGTLDAFGVDGNAAWQQVLKANMAKEVVVKPTRPNKLGLPDLIKPSGWQAPDHSGNHGTFGNMFK